MSIYFGEQNRESYNLCTSRTNPRSAETNISTYSFYIYSSHGFSRMVLL